MSHALRRAGHLGAITAVVALLLGTALLGGCARKSAVAQPPVDPVANATPAGLAQMTPAQKRSRIASDFPMQVPVPVGTVQRGEAQNAGAWDYVIVVPGDVYSVQRWYLQVYANSEWAVVSRTASEVSLQKNNAQSHLQFESAGTSPATTKVTAAVGVGTQVLGTR
jgi:hypothetical protein